MPPLVAIVLKITFVPAQITEEDAVIEMPGITVEFTFIEILFDVAEADEAVVMTQVIISPFVRELFE